MFILTVAAFRPHPVPSIPFYQPDDVGNDKSSIQINQRLTCPRLALRVAVVRVSKNQNAIRLTFSLYAFNDALL
jgi:hypothetical protein